MTRLLTTSLLAAGLLAGGAAQAGIAYLGAVAIPGTGHDLSGLTGKLQDGVFDRNALNGFISAISYTGYGNRYLLLPDRGPNAFPYPGGDAVDQTQDWEARFQVFDLAIGPQSGGTFRVTADFVNTELLTRADGQAYIGLSSTFDDGGANRRLDPEGMRVGPDGSVYISDEYGPHVLRFDAQGRQTGTFLVPAHLTIANPHPKASVENNQNPATGGVPAAVDPRRVTNRGMEGLALSPDGTRLVGMMQNALLQDGGTSGTGVRILVWDTAQPSAAPREYVYRLNTGAGNGMVVSDIVAINDHELLIIERDKDEGRAVRAKRIVKIDLEGATDVAGVADLDDLSGYSPVGQSLFMDLVGNSTGIADFDDFETLLTSAATFDLYPEKLEGLAFGPHLPDGRLLLLLGNDNDFRSDQPNYVFAFAIDPADLAYVPQVFNHNETFGAPVPPTAALLLPLLAMLRRRSR